MVQSNCTTTENPETWDHWDSPPMRTSLDLAESVAVADPAFPWPCYSAEAGWLMRVDAGIE